MPNRYNQLLEPQQYVSQYVPLPLELIAGAGEAKQKESDANKALIKKEMLDDTVKSISEHDDYRNKYMKSFNDQAQALIGDPNIDFASPEGRAKVSELIARHSNDPNIQRMERAIVNKEATLKDLEAIKKEKGAYGYWNDPLLQEEKLKSMGINPYMDENGQTKEYERKTILRREDHDKPIIDLFKEIKDSGRESAYASLSGDKTVIGTGKDGKTGVTRGQIQAIADANVDNYIQSEGGQDYMRKLQYDYSDALSQMPPDKQEAFLNQKAKEKMYQIGEAFIRSNTTQDRNLKTTSLFGEAERAAQVKDILKSTTAPGDTNAQEQMIGGKPISEYLKTDANGKIILDKDNKPVIDNLKLQESMTKGGKSSGFWNTAARIFAPGMGTMEEAAKKLTPEEFSTKIAKFGKTMGFKSLPETLQYMQNVAVSSNSIVLPTAEISKGLGDKIDQQFDKNQMKDDKGVSLQQLEQSYKTDGGSSKFQGIDLSDKENPKFKYEFKDSKGNITYAFMSIPDKNYSNALKPIANIVNDAQDVMIGKFVSGPGGTADQITEASHALLANGSKVDANKNTLLQRMGVEKFSDLSPIMTKHNPDGTVLYLYNDKKHPGEIRAFESDASGKQEPILNFADYVSSRVDSDFIFPISGDVISNNKTKGTYNQSESSDQNDI